jgi:hypothetical protein
MYCLSLLQPIYVGFRRLFQLEHNELLLNPILKTGVSKFC